VSTLQVEIVGRPEKDGVHLEPRLVKAAVVKRKASHYVVESVKERIELPLTQYTADEGAVD